MKNFVLLFMAVIFVLNGFALEAGIDDKKESNQVVIGTIDHLYSKILGEKRTIWVHLPRQYPFHGKRKYPVLYLLDGSGHFYSVSGMIRQLSSVNGNQKTPKMIVVAILNTNRTRDLIPKYEPSGGGERFTDFVARELIPYIEQKYPVSKHRTFVGHSLGGLLVINTLFHYPDLFANYVAIEPSLGWGDNRPLVEDPGSVLSGDIYKGKHLYLGIANTLEKGMTIEEVEKATSKRTHHIRQMLKFAKNVDASKNKKVKFKWKYYPHETHGSVPLICEYDALCFFFPWYAFDPRELFINPDLKADPDKCLQMITEHYKQVSEHLGYTEHPEEPLIDKMGAYVLKEKHYEFAYSLFQMNLDNYPDSSHAWNSMGDYYLSLADETRAAQCFKKAIDINGNPQSREKLNKLLENQKSTD